MTLNLPQWVMIGLVFVWAIAMYFWTAYQGRKLDRRLGRPPGPWW
ncbi:MAG: hypothetical protein ACRYGP_06010 [Janthinobacterium lividum]